MAFTAYGIPLTLVNSFKYIGRVLLEAYSNWTAVVRNLWRVQKKWERLKNVLSREGSDARALVHIFCLVVGGDGSDSAGGK